ncbi:MAG TPA: vitamin K epoxide reductase family protein [Chthoniobacterales bacterium]|nr:vitamin K epoxide reductase family protein [Chthoniobacterales bacterium]
MKPSSETKLRRFTIILFSLAAIIATAGLADATYLTVQALTGETLVCGGSADCSRVLGSPYARVAGVPVAGFGCVAYFAAFAFATFAGFGYGRARTLLGITVGAMFLVTLWLLYVQAFLLHAFCRYCLFSAALVFLLAALVVLTPRSN